MYYYMHLYQREVTHTIASINRPSQRRCFVALYGIKLYTSSLYAFQNPIKGYAVTVKSR